jgi:glycosyltransferase involved in cell wall biosynthesis
VEGEDGSRDGIPNVILEAMAMRLPVVSTDHSGIPEVVEHGVSGVLVAPRDASALADALEQVLSDAPTARRMGERGREVVEDRFDVRVNVRSLRDRLVPELAAS